MYVKNNNKTTCIKKNFKFECILDFVTGASTTKITYLN